MMHSTDGSGSDPTDSIHIYVGGLAFAAVLALIAMRVLLERK